MENRPVFEDKELTCIDCGHEFIYEAGEQAFFYSKQLSTPLRCRPCRKLRKRALIPDSEIRHGQ
jgi:hypothetical protein